MAKNNLTEYSAKRTFAATPEPPPAVAVAGGGPLLFVVQQHSARRLHYDFRLECDGVLKSWAVPKGPALDPDEKRLAVHVEDHPYDYASFEGVIPPGQYGAGEVIVWDCGVYSPDEGGATWFHDRAQAEREVREGMEKGKLSVLLRGEKLKGSFALVRTKDAKQWLLIKHKDRFAAAVDVTKQNRSVLSGVAVEDLKVVPAHRIPAAQLVPLGALQERAQLKAERDIASADRNAPVAFVAFDLLHFAGINLRKAMYRDRRRYLAQCLLPSPLVQLVHASDDGVALHAAALASGFEGVIGKRKDSRYEAGRRSASWLKVKPTQSADFVVGGYTKGKGSRVPLGAILVGYWDGAKSRGKLHYASHVGSGFDERTLGQVKAKLDSLQRRTCPFVETPELNAPTTWVEPRVVAEVSFQNWTDDNHLRAPVFMRLRDDIDPKAVRRTERGHAPKAASSANASANSFAKSFANSFANPTAGGPIAEVLAQLDNAKATLTIAVGPHRIRLTHLDRVYWPADPALKQPALTKRDLLRYFAQVSPFILPHLADRPLTMIRMPEGIRGQRFFQKHWEQERPDFVETISVFSGHKDERHEYLLCNNLPTLLWLAQSGTLEFHVWHSRAKPGPDATSTSTDYARSEEHTS